MKNNEVKDEFVKLKERVVVDTENFQSIDEVASFLVDNYTDGPIEVKFRNLGPKRGFIVERITPVKLD